MLKGQLLECELFWQSDNWTLTERLRMDR